MKNLLPKILLSLTIFIFLKGISETIRINNINNADSYILRINNINNADSYILRKESCEIIKLIENKNIEIDNNICTITNQKYLYNINIFDSNYIVKYKNNEFVIKKNSLISYTVISH